jgi:hypothetical protein
MRRPWVTPVPGEPVERESRHLLEHALARIANRTQKVLLQAA